MDDEIEHIYLITQIYIFFVGKQVMVTLFTSLIWQGRPLWEKERKVYALACHRSHVSPNLLWFSRKIISVQRSWASNKKTKKEIYFISMKQIYFFVKAHYKKVRVGDFYSSLRHMSF